MIHLEFVIQNQRVIHVRQVVVVGVISVDLEPVSDLLTMLIAPALGLLGSIQAAQQHNVLLVKYFSKQSNKNLNFRT